MSCKVCSQDTGRGGSRMIERKEDHDPAITSIKQPADPDLRSSELLAVRSKSGLLQALTKDANPK